MNSPILSTHPPVQINQSDKVVSKKANSLAVFEVKERTLGFVDLSQIHFYLQATSSTMHSNRSRGQACKAAYTSYALNHVASLEVNEVFVVFVYEL